MEKRRHKKYQKISTQVLTMLITSVILQIEQRKRLKDQRSDKETKSKVPLLTTLETVSKVLMAAAKAVHKNVFLKFQRMEGEMTYDDA